MHNSREYKSWRERFEELTKFITRHRRIPSLKPSAAGTVQYALASWLARQRKNKRTGQLTKRQIKLLESIGIVWNPEKENRKRWEEQYQKLIEFREKNSDRWPNKDSKDKAERMIAYWCHNNRMWFQGRMRDVGKYPKYRKEKLDKIGFEWYPNYRNKRWAKKYEQLKKYREDNPNRWPPVNMYPLYKWIFKQKTRYRNGTLQPERINLLSKIGLDWSYSENRVRR